MIKMAAKKQQAVHGQNKQKVEIHTQRESRRFFLAKRVDFGGVSNILLRMRMRVGHSLKMLKVYIRWWRR
jgi:hypothetical protein